jgi:hypothetical protein
VGILIVGVLSQRLHPHFWRVRIRLGQHTGEISPDRVSIADYTVRYNDTGAVYNSLTVVEDVSERTSDGDSGGAY